MNATAPAPEAPADAPARKPEREIRHPFRILLLVVATIVVLLTLVGVPGMVAVGIGLSLPAGLVAYAFAKSGTYTRPLYRQVAMDDPGIPAEIGRTFAAAVRELDALGFEGAAVFQRVDRATHRGWVLLATHPVRLDTAQVTCFIPKGRPVRMVVNFSTRLADGPRMVTLGGGSVVWGVPAGVDGLRLPATTEVYQVYVVHRWRVRDAGPPVAPPPPAERLEAAHREVEDHGVARGWWRRHADGTLRRTWKGSLVFLAALLAMPVTNWRERRREWRILEQGATDPAR